MSRPILKKNHKRLLRKASRQKVEEHFVKVSPRIRTRKWLSDFNRYRYLCTSTYEKDTRANPPTVDHRQLARYIGASAPAHVIDGWSCLGRAVDAALRGDAYSATHFGYYAELRAAMSLLGSEGVGIFQIRHPILDNDGDTHALSGIRTHSVIWPVLRYWATRPQAATLLDDLVSPNAIRLSRWLAEVGVTIPVRAVAQQWLGSWGLDLAVFDDDHDCRNLASYRPSEFRRPPRVNVHQLTAFVEDLWQLFEPSAGRRFPNVERLLMRSAIRNGTANAPTAADIQRLGLSAAESADWAAFLRRTDDPMPLQLADEQTPVEDPTCHLRIISRAALLLFVASAAVRRLFVNAAYSSGDILFWWGRHGEDRALWNIGAAPADPQDLWADIAQIISDSSSWRTSNPGAAASLRAWRRDRPGALVDFGGFELVGVWALLP